MKTTTGKVINAVKSLDEIRGQTVSKKAAKELFHMRRQLGETVDFYLEQINDLCYRMELEMSPEGSINFGNDIEKRDQFIREVNELERLEVDIDCEKVDLSMEDIKISEKFVEATDGFIDL